MASHASTFRPEIQGLRAIAVLAVMFFHLWPGLVPGGYVGVDVFFVISGYLITGLLLKEAEGTGRISIAGFYGRRIRRLLPAATVTLIAVAICMPLLPSLRWADTAGQLLASAFYVQNWWLARQAVDYLAAENAAGPLQHFWSLSVEEQYYIVWPLVFTAVMWLFRGRSISTRTVFKAIIVVAFGWSLAYSIYLTPRNPGWAYFSTTVRIWELALGGALAVFSGWRRMPDVVRPGLAVLGLLLVVVSTMTLDTESAFPGYIALVPTLGAALVLMGSERKRPDPLLASGPMQYFGDISYSLYLWHWPVIIFTQTLLGRRDFSWIEGLVLIAISTALAHQSKDLVEDRFRTASATIMPQRKVFAAFAASIAILLVASFHWSSMARGEAAVERSAASTKTSDHPGALALTQGVRFDPGVPFVPSAEAAASDVGTAQQERCITTVSGTDVRQCHLGNKNGTWHVVVVGDSHAAQWLPTLETIARLRNWRLTAVIKSACVFGTFAPDARASVSLESMKSCLSWNDKALQVVRDLHPDLLVVAQSVSSMSKVKVEGATSADVVADAIARAWKGLDRPDLPIVAIADTPKFLSSVPDCLATSRGEIKRCARARDAALPKTDPLRLAVAQIPGAQLLDLSDAFCGSDECEPVIGNVLVWRDAHHMTRTFAVSLAPEFGKRLDSTLRSR